MRNRSSRVLTFLLIVFIGQDIFCARNVFAQSSAAKLPYQSGESFIVSQGYNSPPTHIHKDSYALDLTQNGCNAYGKDALAAVPGKVMLAEESGYNGGYGTELLVLDANNRVTRYAHLIPESIPIKIGDEVAAGAVLGKIGNTGLVAGAACAEHPGTHLHFAMYDKNADGSFSAHNAEPISGYTNIKEGKWYISDNAPPLTRVVIETSSPVLSESIITDLSPAPLQSSSSQNENPASDTTIIADAPSGAPAAIIDSPSQSQNNVPIPVSGGVSVTLPPVVAPIVVPPEEENSSTQAAAAPSSTAPTGDDSTTTSTSTVAESSSTSATDGSGTIASSSAPSSDDSSNSSSTATSAPDNNGGDDEASSTSTASSSPSFSFAAPAPVADASAIASFNSSTLSIDFSWTAPRDASGSSDGITYEIFDLDAASGTAETAAPGAPPLWTGTLTEFSFPISGGGDHHFGIQAMDAAGDVSLATTTVCVPDWFITVQPSDDSDSHGSWYDDNWYDLGTGFYGTIRALTLEGYINDEAFAKSELTLQEFLDPEYTTLNQQFAISGDAPFTNVNAKITIGGLNIPLQPNKYYRLYTSQDWQNRSVILKGTTATGTAMWDAFVYGAGGVQYKYAFYPYLAWTFVPNFPPLAAPNPPATVSINFNPLLSRLDFSWPPATDPDTSQSLLTYETNCGTSPAPDPANWQPAGSTLSASCTIDPLKDHYVSVRATDDLGNISPPFTQEWVSPLTIPIAS